MVLNMDMGKLISMIFPVMVAAVGWMITSVNGMQNELVDIRSKMPALITPQGVPTDSPISAEARNKLKEELNGKIGELNVRIRILEEHDKEFKK
jgi:hypothetical protein